MLRLKYSFLLLIVLFLGSTTFAKNNKYRLIWNDDPATTMTISWNQTSGKNAQVYYGTTDHQKNASAYPNSKKIDRVEIFRSMKTFFVRLKNLQPNTSYYFIIKDSEGVSKRFWFKTAADNPYERLSIIAGGDSRNHRKGRQNANRLVSKLRPHCVMFGGDMTSRDNDKQWQEWFDDWQLTTTKDGQMIPIIPARGNHEYSNGTIMKLFDAPNRHVYYALTFGRNLLRAYTLNSLIAPGGHQKKWLQEDLHQNQDIIWKMAQYHHPIRPHTSRKKEKQKQYDNWARLFYDYQVQLVVECDAHVVKTTYPIRPTYQGNHEEGFIRDDEKGTIYVGEGCWGAPIRPANDSKSWTRASGSFNQIKLIWISDSNIEIRTVKTDNAKSVGSNSRNNIFSLPSNIDIWKPKTGSVIIINRRDKVLAKKENITIKKEVKKPVKSHKKTSKKVVAKKAPKAKKKPVKAMKVPFILTDFNVKSENNIVKINWNTISCPDGVRCEIQRSDDGDTKSFKTIGTSNLNTSTILTSYIKWDNSVKEVKAPFAFYRLKNVLPNGKIEYSQPEILSVVSWDNYKKLENKDGWAVMVEFKLDKTSDVEVNVFNENGKLANAHVYTQQIAGTHFRKIDTLFFRKGNYLVQIKHNGTVDYQWFVKN